MTDPIDLTLKRLERLEDGQRRLEEGLRHLEATAEKRFVGIEDALGRIVTVLEAHDRRLEQVVSRLDRLIEVTTRARTDDVERMSDLERRLRALETRPSEP